LRDPEGGFEKTELVDPRLNGGQEGVVSAVGFSFARPIVLPHTSEGVVLKLHGRLLAPGGEGEGSHPCLVRILEPGEPGLRGSGEPVMTVIAAFGETYLPAITSVAVSVVVDPGGSFPRFLRGDADDSGDENITDGVYILRFLFRGGTAPACLDAADADDSGGLEITDAVRLFNFLFLGGSAPPRPGPGACGPDPTPDALACASFAPCAG
jgi:hypothetical protein